MSAFLVVQDDAVVRSFLEVVPGSMSRHVVRSVDSATAARESVAASVPDVARSTRVSSALGAVSGRSTRAGHPLESTLCDHAARGSTAVRRTFTCVRRRFDRSARTLAAHRERVNRAFAALSGQFPPVEPLVSHERMAGTPGQPRSKRGWPALRPGAPPLDAARAHPLTHRHHSAFNLGDDHMPAPEVAPIRDMEDAEKAYKRVEDKIEAQDPADLSAQNVDILQAASVAIGVAPAIMKYRDRCAKLPEFDIGNMDNLVDYAKAAWFVYVTNLPRPEAPRELEAEVGPLRSKLLLWAEPLAASGIFSKEAVDKIKEGAGTRNAAGDLVSLTALYKSSWDEVEAMCGVTEEDLDRASKIGPAVFSAVSLRDNDGNVTPTEAALRVRKAWTVLDRAYQQCQRAVTYFRYVEGDADTIAPSLRRNPGGRRSKKATAPASSTATADPGAQPPAAPPTPVEPVAPVTPAQPPAASGSSPVTNK